MSCVVSADMNMGVIVLRNLKTTNNLCGVPMFSLCLCENINRL